MCKYIFSLLSVVILLLAIIYNYNNTNNIKDIKKEINNKIINDFNNILINEFNEDKDCKFISSNYTINDNEIIIKTLALINEKTINITIYFPIKYLQNFYLYKYNETHIKDFYQILKNETYKYNVNNIDIETYFNDYNENYNFQNIIDFINNIDSLFIKSTIITIIICVIIKFIDMLLCNELI